MDIINACFDFYIETLRTFDKGASVFNTILNAAINGEDVEDDLANFACDAERYGFEYGFRFALAIQLLNKETIRLPEDLGNLLANVGGQS